MIKVVDERKFEVKEEKGGTFLMNMNNADTTWATRQNSFREETEALPIPLMTTFNAVYQTTQLNKLYKEWSWNLSFFQANNFLNNASHLDILAGYAIIYFAPLS